MPAKLVNNMLSLSRIKKISQTSVIRKIKKLATATPGFEGEGFPVRRAFTEISPRDTDPFILMDHMGEIDYEVGEAKGTPWHPHRGFETVTYLIDGYFKHKDSNGGGGLIGNGDTQWMTAGAGILHIEAPTEEAVLKGGLFHGVQIWVNLPKILKWSNPRYQDIKSQKLKLLASEDGSSLIRVIAGEIDGHRGPGITHTPISIIHLSMPPDSSVKIPWNPKYNAIGYILAGNGETGDEKIKISTGKTIVFDDGDFMTFSSNSIQDTSSKNLELLILGGEPINEPIAWAGPFVMNHREELRDAYNDYNSGKLGSIPVIE